MYTVIVDLLDGLQKEFHVNGWFDTEVLVEDLREGEYWPVDHIIGISTYVDCIVHGREFADLSGICWKCANEQEELQRRVEDELWDAREFDEYQQMKSDLRIQM